MDESPREEPKGERPHRERVRKKVRVRVHKGRSTRLKKWLRKNSTPIALWGAFALAVLVLLVLVYTGQLRAPAPPPPPE